ncbi:MAG: hypothetical protein RMJ35_10440, partial [Phycisphaerales bacterium]|nr:hypothetical protein [Phycisphaerales bacterium]
MQYVIAGGLGLAGALSPVALAVVAGIVCVGALVFVKPPATKPPAADVWLFGGLVFVVGFVSAVIWGHRDLPAMGDDPLTYHLPAAVTWLQQGRICIYETWNFNPANSYSPLAGSIFAIWLLAPLGNDVLARFLQSPAVVAVFLAAVQIARRLGAAPAVSVLLGLACALCRPIVGQSAMAKDDVFLTAFVLLGIGGLAMPGPAAPMRIGLAFALAAATKYTALYSLIPILLLVFPPRKVFSWRIATVAVTVVVLAGPWYLRNWLFFGNPVFPVMVAPGGVELFPGLFETTVSPRLRQPQELWRLFVAGYWGLGTAVALLVAAGWVGAWLSKPGTKLRQPLARLVLTGPLVAGLVFFASSPYAELRFVQVWIAVMICAMALLPHRIQTPAAAGVAIAAISTSFAPQFLLSFVVVAVGVSAGAILLRSLLGGRPSLRPYVLATGAIVAAASVWVWWRAY